MFIFSTLPLLVIQFKKVEKRLFIGLIVSIFFTMIFYSYLSDDSKTIDELELNKMCDLRSYIYSKKPGDKVELKLVRNKKEIAIEVVLGNSY